jgi:hypothetical protein
MTLYLLSAANLCFVGFVGGFAIGKELFLAYGPRAAA